MNPNIDFTDCPWAENAINLRGTRLTVEQKLWLGKQMSLHEKCAKYLQERYQLKRTVLWKYQKCYRSQIPMRLSWGRPRAIDFESQQIIRTYVRSESPSKELFKVVLKEEHESTVRRNKPGIDDNAIKPLSKRTIGRYIVAILYEEPVNDYLDFGII